MTDLGELSLWIALLMAVWGAALSCAGGALGRGELVASGERGVFVASLFVVLAAAGLWWALLSDDFSIRYVAMFSSQDLPAPYKLSAAWAGRDGSALMFALCLAVGTTVALGLVRSRRKDLIPWLSGSLGVLLVAALVFVATTRNPYARLAVAAADGRGLDPRLQLPLAAVRLPLLYCGFAAACVALALTLAAAVKRRLDAEWRGALRACLAVVWCFAATSALLALRIAYVEHGASGAWSWWGASTVVEIPDGGTARARDPFGREWSFTSQGASRMERPNHFVTAVALRSVQGSSRARFITSEIREYYANDDRERFAPYTTTGIRASPLEDVLVTLEAAEEGKAKIRIGFVPLASWVWIGSALFVLGGAMVLWPRRAARDGIA